MHLWQLKSGLWSHKIGSSLKSGPIYKKNYWCIQIVVLQERWSLNSGVSDDRFYCIKISSSNLGEKNYPVSVYSDTVCVREPYNLVLLYQGVISR